VPPYVIFHDATLRELARALPRDEKGFLAVKGAGPSRWTKYGERVVAITGKARPPAPPPPPPIAEVAPPMVREPADVPPPWLDDVPLPEETRPAQPPRGADDVWTLCSSGASLGEICTRLRRTSADVASQLADGARQGRALDVGKLLGAERVEAIRTAARGAGGDLVAVRKRLPFPAALAEIRLALVANAV
jgi:hypothetical protein